MQKKLIALAIAGLSSAAFAQSNVTIYGQLQPSYDFLSTTGVPGVSDSIKSKNMSNNASRVGFKGEENLGNGLKAIFQLETYFGLTDKGGWMGESTGDGGLRDSFVGLSSSSYGTVMFGAMDNAYKKTFAKYDFMADSIGDMNSVLTNGLSDRNNINGSGSRQSQGAYYLSPNFSGFTVAASYAFGDNNQLTGSGVTPDEKHTFRSIAGDYTNGPLTATLAWADRNQEGAVGALNNKKDNNWRAGLAYTLPTKTVIQGIYEKVRGWNAAGTVNNMERTNWLIGAKHPMGNFDLMALYGKAGDNKKAATDTAAKFFALGAQYNLSKRTNILGVYAKVNNEDAGTANLDTAVIGGAAGSTTSGFSVRLQHKF